MISYLRLISHALREFFEEQNSKITSSHVRMLILVPWKIVSVSTEYFWRQCPHFQSRRSVGLPVRVLRSSPFFGFRKFCRPTAPHFGHASGPLSPPHRNRSNNT